MTTIGKLPESQQLHEVKTAESQTVSQPDGGPIFDYVIGGKKSADLNLIN